MIRKQILLPVLNSQQITNIYAQHRPYRKGGNRLQKQIFGDKIIIHNYGHGGAGVSLAPGSGLKAVQMIQNELTKTQSIGVIGCGIIGLFTVYQLLKKGFKGQVNIYAQIIPDKNKKQNQKMIPSEVAPGFWLPYSYGSNNVKMHQQLSQISYDKYEQMTKDEKFNQFVKFVDVFDVSVGEQRNILRSHLTKSLKQSIRDQKLKINNCQYTCQYFKTIKINLRQFLQIMIQFLLKHNVMIIQKRLNNKQLLQLNQKIIFNCSGLGSRQLFNDNNMKGIKGHLIEYVNKDIKNYDYILKINIGDKIMMYYMHDNRIILGRNYGQNQSKQIQQPVVKQILSAHSQIYKHVCNLTPKL